MGGGLIQLMAVGPQNKKMCGNPKVSFFKHVYNQYCNFGVEWFYQYFEGNKTFGKTIKCILDKKGDLLRNMYIVFEVSSNTVNIPKLGLRLIDSVEIQIGGQPIDKHYGEWLDIWTQLTASKGQYEIFKTLINDRDSSNIFNSSSASSKCGSTTQFKRVFVPLSFWFNNNPGLALPLIALQYHEVVLYLKIKSLENLDVYTYSNDIGPVIANSNNIPQKLSGNNLTVVSTSDISGLNVSGGENFLSTPINRSNNKWHKVPFEGEINEIYMMCEYIFLDPKEKKSFTSGNLEYLITQVQCSNKIDLNELSSAAPTGSDEFTLQFNHPISELIWTVYPSWLDNLLFYKNMDNSNTLTSIELFANNSRITEIDEPELYSLLGPFQNHLCGGLFSGCCKNNLNGGFYVHSFALHPSSHQPTGSLNFSKLNSFAINFNYQKTSNNYSTITEKFKILVFGRNYNILKIENGMGGVLYSS